MNRNFLFLMAMLGSTACSSKQDANEKNFGQAVSAHLEKSGALCLARGRWKDPAQVSNDGPAFTNITKEMEVLEQLGLAKVSEPPQPGGGKEKLYVLTDMGRKFYHAKAADGGMDASALCYGKKTLDKIVKWEGPMKFGDYQVAGVTYTYKIDDLADWAKQPEFQAHFTKDAAVIKSAGNKHETIGATLTNLGWEAK
jgi:DNA-binding PadR family transcriptional regulator